MFEYFCPKTLGEALKLLDEYGDECKIIAGGQSLVPIMNMRLATPKILIDINRISDLNYIKKDQDIIRIGALTRQSEIGNSPIIAESCGILTEVIPYIGHNQTRNRGTIGGSMVHADPTAELPLSLLVLGGAVQIYSVDEVRVVDVEDFFITYLTTDVMPNELLTEIHIPIPAEKQGYSFAEISRRHGDFALVAAACQMTVDDHGEIVSGRLVLGGVEAIPLLVEDAFNVLSEQMLTDSIIKEVQEVVEGTLDAESDLHASAEYRVHLAKVLTSRVLKEAYQRAGGEQIVT